eukprot:3110919-Prymnesium_polylepis.1
MTALGAVLPSYDVETRILDTGLTGAMPLYAGLGLVLVIFFCLLEAIEMQNGLWTYFKGSAAALELSRQQPILYYSHRVNLSPLTLAADLWNVMDWLNFLLYFLVVNDLWHATRAANTQECASYLCTHVGYFDDWDAMNSFRETKTSLALCMCIQLLKILKFAAALVPKVGLATNVLRKCVVDVIFFGFTFIGASAARSNYGRFATLASDWQHLCALAPDGRRGSCIPLWRHSVDARLLNDALRAARHRDGGLLGPVQLVHLALPRALRRHRHRPDHGKLERLPQHAALPRLPLRRHLHHALDVPRDPRRGAGPSARRRAA